MATADTAARTAAGSSALDPARWAADCCIAALAEVAPAGLAFAVVENFAAAGRPTEPVVDLAAEAVAELVLELAAAAPAVVAEPAPAR